MGEGRGRSAGAYGPAPPGGMEGVGGGWGGLTGATCPPPLGEVPDWRGRGGSCARARDRRGPRDTRVAGNGAEGARPLRERGWRCGESHWG